MTQVNWHPYPKEQPAKRGNYLVTLEATWGKRYIEVDFYRGKWDVFSHKDGSYFVIAWAELPEPYDPEKGDSA